MSAGIKTERANLIAYIKTERALLESDGASRYFESAAKQNYRSASGGKKGVRISERGRPEETEKAIRKKKIKCGAGRKRFFIITK